MTKALVTGSTGFIGSHLVNLLVKKGISVKCLIRKTSNTRWLKDHPVDLVTGSLNDKFSLIEAIKDVDYIFHIGGVTKAKNTEEFYKGNYEGTKNLLDVTRKHNRTLKRFVFCSSQAAAGPSENKIPLKEDNIPKPVSVYGKSKLKAENIVIEYGKYFPFTIIRPPSVFGPRDEDFFFILKLINRRIAPILCNENKYYNFIYVDDLVNGIYLSALKEEGRNQIFFICNEKIYSWGDVIEIVSKILDKSPVKIKIPLPMLYLSAAVSDFFSKITGKATIFSLQKVSELKRDYWVCSPEKARKLLGFQPEHSFTQGLEITIKWYKETGYLK